MSETMLERDRKAELLHRLAEIEAADPDASLPLAEAVELYQILTPEWVLALDKAMEG